MHCLNTIFSPNHHHNGFVAAGPLGNTHVTGLIVLTHENLKNHVTTTAMR